MTESGVPNRQASIIAFALLELQILNDFIHEFNRSSSIINYVVPREITDMLNNPVNVIKLVNIDVESVRHTIDEDVLSFIEYVNYIIEDSLSKCGDNVECYRNEITKYGIYELANSDGFLVTSRFFDEWRRRTSRGVTFMRELAYKLSSVLNVDVERIYKVAKCFDGKSRRGVVLLKEWIGQILAGEV